MRAAGAIERSKPKESPLTRERLFRDHACLKSCAARVVALSERGIELGRTAFYPRGAGRVRLLKIPGSTCNPAAAPTSATSPRSAG